MNKVDELMGYAFQFAWEYHATNTCSEGPRKLMLRDALTATLAEKDAQIADSERHERDCRALLAKADDRIAELEAQVSRLHKALAEREAEIKGLERENNDLESQVVGQAFPHAPVIAVTPDDDRRFVDECAMRVYVRLAEVNDSCDEANAKWAYDAAESLAAERKRRVG